LMHGRLSVFFAAGPREDKNPNSRAARAAGPSVSNPTF
jgi:hypothetical protein